MRYVILIICLLLNGFLIAQENDIFEFQPLSEVDRIKIPKTLKDFKGMDKVNDTFFFATEYYKGNKGLFLIEKNIKYWIVYDYNLVSNTVGGKHITLNKNYVSTSVTLFKSGLGTNIYCFYIIFDLKNKTFLTLYTSEYNADGNGVILTKCDASIKFKNNHFTIKRTSYKKRKCEYCIGSGIYKIEKNKFIKIKNM
jgi:hypothetical protein